MSGAAGKVGSAVVSMLRADGAQVVAVDRATTGDWGRRVDLLDYQATMGSMTGADAVVHLAAYPSPQNVTPSWLVENNVMATFNVLEAASELGIKRVVLASSGSIYGYAWSPTMLEPNYLPVDEDTRLDFVDPYALTKDLGERIGQMYARRGMSVVALRLHWVLSEEELHQRKDTGDGEDGARNLWGYVELSDAARAFSLAVAADLPDRGFFPLVIAAADTMSSTPTDTLLQRWFPTVERRREFRGTCSVFDSSRARELIAWAPTFQW
ncbi:MAG: NAD(P)-dependent oxidoreductase [Actinomycetota bacterium]|nr:NAD(P)-dependent oxidoreductase [Actinomycetota bacterium]